MTVYYNEHDPKAAAWLRELISDGLIAAGDVDERGIEDVRPSDLAGYQQCHFFAGIGGWPYALRLAGWPDDRPVWTGSCPCQPFSQAGKGKGAADERHLWPAFHWLIQQCRPAIVFGEQVASKAGREWLDVVSSDLEALGFAVGAADLCAAGVGAPHIRQRLYWVADNGGERLERGSKRTMGNECQAVERGCSIGGLDNAAGTRHVRQIEGAEEDPRGETRLCLPGERCGPGGLADSQIHRRNEERAHTGGVARRDREEGQSAGHGAGSGDCRPSPTQGFWRDPDWLYCRDGKWRPVESGTFPLAHGVSARVVRLRGYGNAIVPQVAAEFIRAAHQ